MRFQRFEDFFQSPLKISKICELDDFSNSKIVQSQSRENPTAKSSDREHSVTMNHVFWNESLHFLLESQKEVDRNRGVEQLRLTRQPLSPRREP